ncbi:MAG: CehA/McbA family metallohydrolase [Gemmatimonadaceae bacterium]
MVITTVRRSCGVCAATFLLPALATLSAPQLHAQRRPVLEQIALPHAYYYREMYVPQVTSGPSAVSWSPDGKEVIYSMQGSLWRQTVGASVARQIASGPGYLYQPDWSPDGRWVAYAAYDSDAIELRLLDLTTGKFTPITANGAVNVEPRWSPDGTRLAFVSSSHNRRWHIFTIAVSAGVPGALERLTEDHDSKSLRRYYYSDWDHYLSPTWSPDGAEIIFVSNRGRIHGTGGFWRMRAQAGATAREIRYEETTWKARPDWSPDGKRVIYSSYLGGQWHQLWLIPPDGGDPFPLTYGDFDATAARWSRDGKKIAFITNEGGNTSLEIIDAIGGKRQRVEAGTRTYLESMARLRIVVTDKVTGKQMPARISVTASDGRCYAPDSAWRHADEAFVRGEQKFEAAYFHTDGTDEVMVPPGVVTVEVSRGPEYAIARDTLTLRAGRTSTHREVLARVANMRASGWRSGDLHVHMNYVGAYRNTPGHLAFQARAEDLDVVENLIVNKEQRIPDITYFRTSPDPVSTANFLLMHGQEYHTSYWGHVALIGLGEHYVLPDYAGYVNTAASSLQPSNAVVADLAHEQGALVGYVHPFDTRPDPRNAQEALTFALPIDVALGKVDYLEVMGFSDHLITSEIWYRLLNCGFRIPAVAGTDAFPNYASLRGPAGLLRVYARAGASLDHRRWLAAIKGGRTMVTNAPLLTFTLDGQEPGAEIRVPSGSAHLLAARVTVRSNVPVDHVEIIGNGKVMAAVALAGDRTRADTALSIPVDRSGWYILRAWSEKPAPGILDLYPFASTSPIYVSVGGEQIESREDAEFFLTWIDRVDTATRAHTGWNTDAERASALEMIERARAVYRSLAER